MDHYLIKITDIALYLEILHNRLQGIGSPNILNNIYKGSTPNSKLYHNHESFCLLKNGKIYAFGQANYGGGYQIFRNRIK